MARGINWQNIKADYIKNHDVTHEQLAEKYNVSKKQVTTHAKNEDWLKLRQEVTNRVDDRIIENKVDEIEKMLNRHRQHGKNLQALAIRRLSELSNKDGKAPNERTIKDLGYAIKIAIEIERTAMGLPTQITDQRLGNIDNDPLKVIIEDYAGVTDKEQ